MDATKLWSEVPMGARVRQDQDREPQTGRLLDGTPHCAACGSEVQPLGASSTPSVSGYRSEAYWAGWIDGRFREPGTFADNPMLVRWETPSERLDYYHGHRAVRDARRRGSSWLSKAHERSSGRTRP